MKRTRTSVLRRAVMWAAGVVLVVSVVAWLVSLFGVYWTPAEESGWAVGLNSGAYWASRGPHGNPIGWYLVRR